MSKTNIPKFLMAAFNMVKRGDIKSVDDLFKFAKQEFGEITSSLKSQIEDTFKKGQAAAITEKRTKDMSMGDPTGEGLSQFKKNIDELRKQLKELDKLDDRNKDITKDLEDALTGQIFKRPMGSTDATKPFKTPGMPFQRKNPNYRLKKIEDRRNEKRRKMYGEQ